MPVQEGTCQEAGDWALRILAGMVLQCVAANLISQLRQPPQGSRRRAPHCHTPQAERPPQTARSASRPRKPLPRPVPRSSEHSSAWLSLAAAPGPPPPPRPARLLICCSGLRWPPLGQVIYDARRAAPDRATKDRPAWQR